MIELTHGALAAPGTPHADARTFALTRRCADLDRETVEIMTGEFGDDDIDMGGLRYAVVTDAADLRPDGPLAEWMGGVDGDPLSEVLLRQEGVHSWSDVAAYLVVCSLSDAGADYIILPAELLPLAWALAIGELSGEPVSTAA